MTVRQLIAAAATPLAPSRASTIEKRMRRGTTLRPPERAHLLALRVVEGCLRVCHPLTDGRRQITDFLFAEDRFNLNELRSHNGTIEAVAPARIRLFRPDVLDRDEAADGEIYEARLTAMQARIFMLGHKTAREKLAAFVIEMSDRIGQGEDSFQLPMSRSDIADYLCLSPETVCRNFTQLVSDGLLALPGAQTVQILHRAPLEFIGR